MYLKEQNYLKKITKNCDYTKYNIPEISNIKINKKTCCTENAKLIQNI